MPLIDLKHAWWITEGPFSSPSYAEEPDKVQTWLHGNIPNFDGVTCEARTITRPACQGDLSEAAKLAQLSADMNTLLDQLKGQLSDWTVSGNVIHGTLSGVESWWKIGWRTQPIGEVPGQVTAGIAYCASGNSEACMNAAYSQMVADVQ